MEIIDFPELKNMLASGNRRIFKVKSVQTTDVIKAADSVYCNSETITIMKKASISTMEIYITDREDRCYKHLDNDKEDTTL